MMCVVAQRRMGRLVAVLASAIAVTALLSMSVQLRCCAGMGRQKMSSIYGFEEWSPRMTYQAAATNWWAPTLVGCLGGANVATNAASDSSVVVDLIWETGNPTGDGSLLVVETNSFSSAVEVMVQRFSQCAAVQPFPRAQGVYASIGDVCFTAFPQGCSNCFDFVRNNVYVSVEASDNCVASKLAFAIDSAILNASTNAPGM